MQSVTARDRNSIRRDAIKRYMQVDTVSRRHLLTVETGDYHLAMNATSISPISRRALISALGCTLPMALVGCLITAPPPPTKNASPPPPTATRPAPAASTGQPPLRPRPRPSAGFSTPPPTRPGTRPMPQHRGHISPASARPGVQVAILADFSVAAQKPAEVSVWFPGAAASKPVSVRPDRLVVQVPAGARSGEVRVTFRRRVLWSGGFSVLPSSPPPTTTPAVDCQNPPSMMCCKAMTEACMACSSRARAARAAWERQCRGQPSTNPTPAPAPAPKPVIDCSKRPLPRACCKALLPACTECQRKSDEEQRRWNAACRRP